MSGTEQLNLLSAGSGGLQVNRKLSVDVARKLSAISVASDVSAISHRFGMEQDQLKSIVQDILELDINDDWEVGSDDGLSEFEDIDLGDDPTVWKELQKENILIDERKSSTRSEASTDSLDEAEDFRPVEINLGEIKSVLNLYKKHKISMSRITGEERKKF